MHIDLVGLIQTIGLLGVLAIVFAESGLLVGFFLPGDSLLFTAGFLASQNFLDIRLLVVGCFVAAVAGDSVGYAFGHKVGKRLFYRKDSIFFHRDHLEKARIFYEKHGKKTIILARFLPVVRTFAPIVAGMGDMHYPTFLAFNVIGGALWAIGLTLSGFYLGKSIPDVDKYLLPIIAVIIILSILPTAIHILKDPSHRREIANAIKKLIGSR